MVAEDKRSDRQRVLIAGAGVAGIEAALALQDLGRDRLDVVIHDQRREFFFRAFAVGQPYGTGSTFRYDLGELAALSGASFEAKSIFSVDHGSRAAVTRDGERLRYDHLIVAPGARMLWAVPGAVTFWGAADEGQVADVVADLRAGRLRRLVFTMPGGHSWALPLYELALLAATEIEKGGLETRVAIATPEDLPLEVFGRYVGERMSELLDERGIELHAGAHPIRFADGRLRVAPGEEIEADAVISLPRLEGRRIGGVPHDGDGFVGVDEHNRVIGLDRVYAIGDVTSFPVKQGGIATQQADAVAEAIAAAAGADVKPKPFDPILRGVLWTGAGPRYLYGRPTGGHGEASGFSERPQGPMRSGKVTARYFTPLVERLTAEAVPPAQKREEGEGGREAVA
jgi:sulfide:quinone oxidoreductase